MRAKGPTVVALTLLVVAVLAAAVGGASAHTGHGDDPNTSTHEENATDGNATDDATATDDDGSAAPGEDVPWFPIIAGGLLVLAVAIMGVRRVIEARKDGDDGDGADDV